MEDIGILRADLLWSSFLGKPRNLLPEEVEHSVRWRMTIIGSPVHLAAGNDIYSGGFLIQNGSLAGSILCISHIRFRKGTYLYLPLKGLVPTGNTIGPYNCSRVLGILRHSDVSSLE